MKEIVCEADYWPLIPNDTYEAQCIRYNTGFVLGKSKKIFLIFKILNQGQYFGMEIFQAYNMPYNKKFRPGHKYYKDWVMMNGWKAPSKNTSMSPRIFKNKIFIIKTRTTKPKRKNKEMPKEFWYSVVDEITKVIQ